MNVIDVFKSCLDAQLRMQTSCANITPNNSELCKWISITIHLGNANCFIEIFFRPLICTFIVIGTILNLFSLCIFLKINKRNSQNVYLCVLSLVDTINLHINFALPMLRQWDAFDTAFRNWLVICRLTGVFTEFFFIFPTWIVVLLTIERLISILLASDRRPLFTQHRARFSIIVLAVLTLGLSLYRCQDLRGIDQISVFRLVTCNATDKSVVWIRNVNLMIWTIVPECLTLLMSLVIVYRIRSMARKLQSDGSRNRRSQYTQATRTVLLVAILFLVFHIPTGITIALDLFDSSKTMLKMVIILGSRKLTILLYEMNLSCKFFIYRRTFRSSRVLRKLTFQFTRRPNSARLGRRTPEDAVDCSNRPRIHFSAHKPSMTSPTSQSDSHTRHEDDEHCVLNNRSGRTYSSNLSRIHRDQQPLTVRTPKSNRKAHVSLTRGPDFPMRHSIERQ